MSETKERPILFSGPMVRALFSGAKTQTRRVVKPSVVGFVDGAPCSRIVRARLGDVEEHTEIRCPYGQPGDRLWVRERWMTPPGHLELATPRELRRDTPVRYGADGAVRGDSGRFVDAAGRFAFGRGRPSIHMPRWASRLTLEIAGVRVERLHAISEEDARAEGVEDLDHFREAPDFDRAVCRECGGTRLHLALGRNLGVTEVDCSHCDTYRKRFRNLWHHINGAASWATNPWVWVVEFRMVA